jgi:hypothetical protein
MTKKLLFVTTILLVVAIAAFAADVSGKWTYEQPGRGGGPGRPVTITLKQDGTKLTGSVPGMGRGGDNPPPPTEITNGKVDGDKVSFEVVREFQGNKMTSKYAGTVSGDEMKLHVTTETPNGARESDVTAKRGGTN